MSNTFRLRIFALLAGLLAASAAGAQSTVPALDGAWAARVKVPVSGREFLGSANLAGGAGHWQFTVKNPNDPCVGLRVPLAWRRTEAGDVELSILTSKALTGCADSAMVLKLVDANTLQGRSPAGFEVTLARQP